jgi:hypothetical protein
MKAQSLSSSLQSVFLLEVQLSDFNSGLERGLLLVRDTTKFMPLEMLPDSRSPQYYLCVGKLC